MYGTANPDVTSAAKWLLLAAVTVCVTVPLTMLGVPSALLLAGLLGGIALALMSLAPKRVPRRVDIASQGVLGVHIGTMVQPDAFEALRSSWPMVFAVVTATLVLSVVGGALLGRHRTVSPLTGALALVAGGSAGLVSIARELGGDERVVAAVQYLRVALIVASMPLLATMINHAGTSHPAPPIRESGSAPWYLSIVLLAVIVVAGARAGQFVRLPGAGLLGPLSITIVLELTGVSFGLVVPAILVQIGYMVIGWQAGVAFTRESVRAIQRILPAALGLIVLINLASAGLGALLAYSSGVSRLDGYLATTPGGINAVLATAVESGANVTFIMTAQVMRLLLMLFAAPLVARGFMRFGQPRADRNFATTSARGAGCAWGPAILPAA
jgi:membrane AbrB-like protein